MATAATPEYPHISADPGVCHGRPCIAGTRIRVMDVVAAHRAGHSAEDLQDFFSTRPLTLGEVHAALGYYYDHREEIEADFAPDERLSAGREPA